MPSRPAAANQAAPIGELVVSAQIVSGPNGPQLTAEDDYSRYRWVIIGQLVLQQLFGMLTFSSLGVLLPSMRSELGFGVIESGWLGSARMFGQLIVFPASIFMVRFSPVRAFNVFALILAGALFLGGVAPTYWVVVAAIVVYSIGGAFGQTPA